MVNVDKLKGKISEKRYSLEFLSEKLEMDRTALYRKLNGNGKSFTIKEADEIVKELGLSESEAIAIFFN